MHCLYDTYVLSFVMGHKRHFEFFFVMKYESGKSLLSFKNVLQVKYSYISMILLSSFNSSVIAEYLCLDTNST